MEYESCCDDETVLLGRGTGYIQWNYSVFEWFHLYLWQALIILDALVVWLIWLRTLPRVVLREPPQPEAA